MTLLLRINFFLVTALGLTAGIPKIMRMPSEVSFFEKAGFGEAALLAFGVLQLVGGLLLLYRGTRRWGALLSAAMFLGSALMLLGTGQLAFGAASLLPVVMAALAGQAASERTSTAT